MNSFINLILEHMAWFWLGVMIVCIAIEAFTFQLTTVWAGLSAFFMIFISRTGLPMRWQVLIVLVMTIAFILFTRPFVMKKLKLGKNVTNVNTLEGQEVLVTKDVSQFEKGEAKAANGVIWSVTSENGASIQAGAVCVIVRVDGNTLTIRTKD